MQMLERESKREKTLEARAKEQRAKDKRAAERYAATRRFRNPSPAGALPSHRPPQATHPCEIRCYPNECARRATSYTHSVIFALMIILAELPSSLSPRFRGTKQSRASKRSFGKTSAGPACPELLTGLRGRTPQRVRIARRSTPVR